MIKGGDVTLDGREMMVYCNIGSPEDAHAVQANDGQGIGLFRSEFLYLAANDYRGGAVQGIQGSGHGHERQTGGLPHPGYRRGQVSGVFPPPERRKSGHGCAGYPHLIGPAGGVSHPTACAAIEIVNAGIIFA